MRVIAGKARRTVLKTVEGQETRPTTDRIKETLFNILNFDLYDCRFLDLFAGSGAIAIEALSRGAGQAVLVESSQKAAACIGENLEKTRLADQALLMVCDVFAALRKLDGQGEAFDYIFMDPPYYQDLERQVLEFLSRSCLMGDDTVVIVEAALETEFDYLSSLGLVCTREKIYKTNKHVFIARGETV